MANHQKLMNPFTKHPELTESEFLLCTIDSEFRLGNQGHKPERWAAMRSKWKTSRVGEVAYSAGGEVIAGRLPVFAQISEHPELAKQIISQWNSVEAKYS